MDIASWSPASLALNCVFIASCLQVMHIVPSELSRQLDRPALDACRDLIVHMKIRGAISCRVHRVIELRVVLPLLVIGSFAAVIG